MGVFPLVSTLDQSAGLIDAMIGALVVLFVWNRLVAHHINSDPGDPGSFFATSLIMDRLLFQSGRYSRPTQGG